MRSASLLAVLFLALIASAQNLSTPQAVTDAAKLQSLTLIDFQPIDLDKFFLTRQFDGATWSPDGKRVAFTSNISGRMNIWLVGANGGWPRQLTVSDQRQTSPVWSPDGKWIAFLSDKDGDELWDIYVVSPKSGEVKNVTMSSRTEEGRPAWSPDGKQIAYAARPKDKPAYEIDVMDIKSQKTTHITQNTPGDRYNDNPIWSKDGKLLAWTQDYADEENADVMMADVKTGKVENLTNHAKGQTFRAAAWSPDGKTILITSDAKNGHPNVGLLDVASTQIKWLTDEKWEMQAVDFTPDGKRAIWTANVDGEVSVRATDLATGMSEAFAIGGGVNTMLEIPNPVSRDGSHLLYMHDGANSPRAIWTYDFASNKAQPVTDALLAGVLPKELVEPTLVHFPSKDGKFTLSAWVYMPYNIQPNHKYPAIVYVHGGPADRSGPSFYPLLQYFVNLGYVIIAPNYRGSSGYGKTFQHADRMDAGGAELQDVVDSAEFIKKSPYVDPKNIVLMGRSYGGYLTLMGVTKFPDEWSAAVPIVPFANWFTAYQNEDATLQASDREFMGDPIANKQLWTERSPAFFVDKIKAPMLILAGGHDPRCPKTEAEAMAQAIRKHGGKVQLKVYEDEGHVFSRTENILDAYKHVSDFVKTYAPSPGCGCSVYE
ncbi:MAG: S9 family peptidase [Terriglobia bacterium]|nr:S9 family peptidase [Terriglobia bacterium]